MYFLQTRPLFHRAAIPLGVSLLFALFVAACDDDPEPTAPNEGTASVSGVVSTLKAGSGVSNLVVVLLQDGRVLRAEATDADGRFAFEDVAAGTYTARLTGLELSELSLRHTAFDPMARDFTLAGEAVELVFTAVGLLPPQVAGRVRCDGVPVEGAEVRVIGGEFDQVVATDAQGTYGATNLVAGHYAVIPVDAPCVLEPRYRAVVIRPGQTVETNFDG